ncbi:mucin-19 isoform X3 [Desmodus rotundus]|uniref:mucin-19 isoform X3 n=1 Tax=Desmodus rotundus TaxID=9430 RepID=UPI0039E70C5D
MNLTFLSLVVILCVFCKDVEASLNSTESEKGSHIPEATPKYSETNAIIGEASTWGKGAYKAFNGRIFSFESSCAYTFCRHCVDSGEFNVEIKRGNESEIENITVLIDSNDISISGDVILVNGESVQLPFNNKLIHIKKYGEYNILNSRRGVLSLMWDKNNKLSLTLHKQYPTCGLCGNFNSTPGEDINEHIANSKIPGDCPAVLSKSYETCEDGVQHCNKTIGIYFEKCGKVTALSSDYKMICIDEYCRQGDKNSTCDTYSELSRLCASDGPGTYESWREDSDVVCEKPRCPEKHIYKECGLSNPATCSNVAPFQDSECVSGCICPEGYLLDDIGEKGRCVLKAECPCESNGKVYQSGEVRKGPCGSQCTCQEAKWSCTEALCPGRCKVEGSSITTFDGEKYNHPGNCHFLAIYDEDWSVSVELRPCPSGQSGTCLTSVTLLLNSSGSVDKYVFDRNGTVTNDKIGNQSYYYSDKVQIFKAFSSYFQVETDFHVKMQIQIVPVMQLYVSMPPNQFTDTVGLCGSYNNRAEDDFMSSQNILEKTSQAFADSWEMMSCPKGNLASCISIETEKFAERHCGVLLNSSGPFASCHAVVNPKPYQEECKKHTCTCENSQDCLCAILGNYAKACAEKGTYIVGWRPGQCDYSCPSGLVFKYNVKACNTSCRSLSERDRSCDIEDVPVDGCTCPDGMYQNSEGNCVSKSQCDCYVDDKVMKPGKLIHIDDNKCICEDGILLCQNPIDLTRHNCSGGAAYVDCRDPKAKRRVDRTCSTRNIPNFEENLPCKRGCYCPEGMVRNSRGHCVFPDDCPCSFGGQEYGQGRVTSVGCNQCTCIKGSWNCTQNECQNTCHIYGEGHIQTFDRKSYSFDGLCQYSFVEDYCGRENGTFRILTESVPCCEDGLTCSRKIIVAFQDQNVILHDGKVTAIKTTESRDCELRGNAYSVHTVGLYLILKFVIGVTVIWDKNTRMSVILDPQWNGKVCGLCGNSNGDLKDDFTTRHSSVATGALEFGNSWKTTQECSDTVAQTFPCDSNPYCKAWAVRKCEIIRDSTFRDCHSKVDPSVYYDACVEEACACDMEGKYLGFCTAVAMYAEACSAVGVCVTWRKPDLCPVYCDYYNAPGECSWHYEPCGTVTAKTCKDRVIGQKFSAFLEGCYAKCPDSAPYLDENTMKCVSLSECSCFYNDVIPAGGVIQDNCGRTCYCIAGELVCSGTASRNSTFKGKMAPSHGGSSGGGYRYGGYRYRGNRYGGYRYERYRYGGSSSAGYGYGGSSGGRYGYGGSSSGGYGYGGARGGRGSGGRGTSSGTMGTTRSSVVGSETTGPSSKTNEGATGMPGTTGSSPESSSATGPPTGGLGTTGSAAGASETTGQSPGESGTTGIPVTDSGSTESLSENSGTTRPSALGTGTTGSRAEHLGTTGVAPGTTVAPGSSNTEATTLLGESKTNGAGIVTGSTAIVPGKTLERGTYHTGATTSMVGKGTSQEGLTGGTTMVSPGASSSPQETQPGTTGASAGPTTGAKTKITGDTGFREAGSGAPTAPHIQPEEETTPREPSTGATSPGNPGTTGQPAEGSGATTVPSSVVTGTMAPSPGGSSGGYHYGGSSGGYHYGGSSGGGYSYGGSSSGGGSGGRGTSSGTMGTTRSSVVGSETTGPSSKTNEGATGMPGTTGSSPESSSATGPPTGGLGTTGSAAGASETTGPSPGESGTTGIPVTDSGSTESLSENSGTTRPSALGTGTTGSRAEHLGTTGVAPGTTVAPGSSNTEATTLLGESKTNGAGIVTGTTGIVPGKTLEPGTYHTAATTSVVGKGTSQEGLTGGTTMVSPGASSSPQETRPGTTGASAGATTGAKTKITGDTSFREAGSGAPTAPHIQPEEETTPREPSTGATSPGNPGTTGQPAEGSGATTAPSSVVTGTMAPSPGGSSGGYHYGGSSGGGYHYGGSSGGGYSYGGSSSGGYGYGGSSGGGGSGGRGTSSGTMGTTRSSVVGSETTGPSSKTNEGATGMPGTTGSSPESSSATGPPTGGLGTTGSAAGASETTGPSPGESGTTGIPVTDSGSTESLSENSGTTRPSALGTGTTGSRAEHLGTTGVAPGTTVAPGSSNTEATTLLGESKTNGAGIVTGSTAIVPGKTLEPGTYHTGATTSVVGKGTSQEGLTGGTTMVSPGASSSPQETRPGTTGASAGATTGAKTKITGDTSFREAGSGAPTAPHIQPEEETTPREPSTGATSPGNPGTTGQPAEGSGATTAPSSVVTGTMAPSPGGSSGGYHYGGSSGGYHYGGSSGGGYSYGGSSSGGYGYGGSSGGGGSGGRGTSSGTMGTTRSSVVGSETTGPSSKTNEGATGMPGTTGSSPESSSATGPPTGGLGTTGSAAGASETTGPSPGESGTTGIPVTDSGSTESLSENSGTTRPSALGTGTTGSRAEHLGTTGVAPGTTVAPGSSNTEATTLLGESKTNGAGIVTGSTAIVPGKTLEPGTYHTGATTSVVGKGTSQEGLTGGTTMVSPGASSSPQETRPGTTGASAGATTGAKTKITGDTSFREAGSGAPTAPHIQPEEETTPREPSTGATSPGNPGTTGQPAEGSGATTAPSSVVTGTMAPSPGGSSGGYHYGGSSGGGYHYGGSSGGGYSYGGSSSGGYGYGGSSGGGGSGGRGTSSGTMGTTRSSVVGSETTGPSSKTNEGATGMPGTTGSSPESSSATGPPTGGLGTTGSAAGASETTGPSPGESGTTGIPVTDSGSTESLSENSGTTRPSALGTGTTGSRAEHLGTTGVAPGTTVAPGSSNTEATTLLGESKTNGAGIVTEATTFPGESQTTRVGINKGTAGIVPGKTPEPGTYNTVGTTAVPQGQGAGSVTEATTYTGGSETTQGRLLGGTTTVASRTALEPGSSNTGTTSPSRGSGATGINTGESSSLVTDIQTGSTGLAPGRTILPGSSSSEIIVEATGNEETENKTGCPAPLPPPPVCHGPLGEEKSPGDVWTANCHKCTCTDANAVECKPKECPSPPTCKTEERLVKFKDNDTCCEIGYCEPRICFFNNTNYEIGASFGDPKNPCVSYFCDKTGLVTVVQDCPRQTWCAEVDRVYDSKKCCYTCNTNCRSSLVNVTVRYNGCAKRLEMARCVGECKKTLRYNYDIFQLENSCLCCQDEKYEFREILLNCPDGSTMSYRYRHITKCSCLNKCYASSSMS